MIVTSTSIPGEGYSEQGYQKMTLDDKLHGTSWGTFGFGGMTILESFYATGIV